MISHLIVIGTSAGGVHALKTIVAALPERINACILAVIHTHAESPRLMSSILTSSGDIKVSYPEDGQLLTSGAMYIAPPDYHILVGADKIQVVRGPKENLHRPAIDPLFRSAAAHFGARAIGIILTGYLDDGTSGLHAIKQCGGTAIVQKPEDAEVPEMPASALRHVDVDYCVNLSEIAPLMDQLTKAAPLELVEPLAPESLQIEAAIPAMKYQEVDVVDKLGVRSTLTCPECHGALWEVYDGKPLRYRCHTGHAYTAKSLAVDQQEALDKALWIALKTLEESATLASQLAAQAQTDNDQFGKELLDVRAAKATKMAASVRSMLMNIDLFAAN